MNISCLVFAKSTILHIKDEEDTGWNFNSLLFFDKR